MKQTNPKLTLRSLRREFETLRAERIKQDRENRSRRTARLMAGRSVSYKL